MAHLNNHHGISSRPYERLVDLAELQIHTAGDIGAIPTRVNLAWVHVLLFN